ncbi:MAG: hypothetical protein K8953_02190, partial [Proteobacteria bacterium]|nr:hypothetical protein [Pseudomonadota bacterium]
RKAACLNTRPASDGLVGGVCYTLAHGSDGFCDGADATDNPYAAVCGDNGANQSAFCMTFVTNLDTPSQTNQNLCSIDPGVVCRANPFRNSSSINCLNNSDFDNARAEDCSDGTQKDASLCNTQKIADAVCISDSNSAYANPFAAFCATENTRTVDSTLTNTQVKQTFCGNTQRTGSMDSRGNACDGLLDGLCSGANSFLTMVGAAGYNCSLDTTRKVNAARVTFCTDPLTTFSADCTSNHGDVAGARRTECLKTGTVAEALDPSNVICNGFVMTACTMNPFQKATANKNIDLCVDTSGTTYADARETECRKMGTSPLEGSDCSNIVSTRCNANPFELTTVTSENLCDETVYPRLAFCRNTDREHGDKANNCMEAIGLACTADRFAQKTGTTGGNLCDADHDADLAFCLDNSKNAPNKMMNCVGTRQTACVNNPFDALCINE